MEVEKLSLELGCATSVFNWRYTRCMLSQKGKHPRPHKKARLLTPAGIVTILGRRTHWNFHTEVHSKIDFPSATVSGISSLPRLWPLSRAQIEGLPHFPHILSVSVWYLPYIWQIRIIKLGTDLWEDILQNCWPQVTSDVILLCPALFAYHLGLFYLVLTTTLELRYIKTDSQKNLFYT